MKMRTIMTNTKNLYINLDTSFETKAKLRKEEKHIHTYIYKRVGEKGIA